LDDVQNILGYFTQLDRDPALEAMSGAERTRQLLQRYALRRLRLMEGQGGLYGKRHYRHEKAVPASFDGRPDAEMFFALYQKRLGGGPGPAKGEKKGSSRLAGNRRSILVPMRIIRMRSKTGWWRISQRLPIPSCCATLCPVS